AASATVTHGESVLEGETQSSCWATRSSISLSSSACASWLSSVSTALSPVDAALSLSACNRATAPPRLNGVGMGKDRAVLRKRVTQHDLCALAFPCFKVFEVALLH